MTTLVLMFLMTQAAASGPEWTFAVRHDHPLERETYDLVWNTIYAPRLQTYRGRAQ